MRIGLTGGIGSGASLVARRLGELGAVIISADEVGHGILALPGVKHDLISAFGEDILDSSGDVNRMRLGKLVFSDDHARESLNRIIQPALLDRVKRLVNEAEAKGRMAVLDAALIYEWGEQEFFHRIIVVNASLETRLSRIASRDNLTRDQALARIEAQILLEKKVELADFVIENEGGLEELYKQVEAVFREITSESNMSHSR
jgi:dephospho-CoA kinase